MRVTVTAAACLCAYAPVWCCGVDMQHLTCACCCVVVSVVCVLVCVVQPPVDRLEREPSTTLLMDEKQTTKWKGERHAARRYGGVRARHMDMHMRDLNKMCHILLPYGGGIRIIT